MNVKMETTDNQVIFTVTGGTDEDMGNLATFLAMGVDVLVEQSGGHKVEEETGESVDGSQL